jgi:hypothetical protein
MIRHFCTYFDSRYMKRGLALYESLRQHCAAFKLYVLCMDSECHRTLAQNSLPGMELIALEEFERGDEELLQAKQNRSPIEYYFTCTPSLPLFVLNTRSDVPVITYLDSDLFFFADPEPLFDELGRGSVAIIPHRFPPQLRWRERAGIYNVSWLSFRRDANGLACLKWWRERCIEWCYDKDEDDRYADQKYLDDWPARFAGVVVLTHKGANLAPWNCANHTLTVNNSHVWVGDQPLIFYHFQGFKQIRGWLYNTNLGGYGTKANRVLLHHVYRPYVYAISKIQPQERVHPGIRYPAAVSPVRRAVARLKKMVRIALTLPKGHYIIVANNRFIKITLP